MNKSWFKIILIIFTCLFVNKTNLVSALGFDDSLEIEDNLSFSCNSIGENNFYMNFYQPVEFDSTANMNQTGLPLDPSMIQNIETVKNQTGLSEVPPDLVKNGFVIIPTAIFSDNIIDAYTEISGPSKSTYISAGMVIYIIRTLSDQILEYLEQKYLYKEVYVLLNYLYQQQINRENLLGAAYFGVPLKILNPDYELNDEVEEMVNMDLKFIQEHNGIQRSAIFEYYEDFSQYQPRGHYSASDSLKNYFKAMMWLGRINFFAQPVIQETFYGLDTLVNREKAKEFTSTSIQIISDLCSGIGDDGESYLVKWNKIYSVTAFFAGFSDDLSVPEYLMTLKDMGINELDPEELNQDRFYNSFISHLGEKYSSPRIYSGIGGFEIIPNNQMEFDPESLTEILEKTTGFRLFGQRYSFDSEVMGLMVFPNIQANTQQQYRFIPSGLDVAAVFGSPGAYQILQELGITDYSGYNQEYQELREKFNQLDTNYWNSSLYSSMLYCLFLMIQPRYQGYPDFMTTPAWEKHSLSNFLSSWAGLRHDNVLYCKEPTTPHAGSAQNPPVGFVEPIPQLYAQLNSSMQTLYKGLEYYGYVDGTLERKLKYTISSLTELQEISEKELSRIPLDEDEANMIRFFHLAINNMLYQRYFDYDQLKITYITDVHTDLNDSLVLEVASGYMDLAIIVYKRPNGDIEAAIGPVLSYYEFTWPRADRLADDQWRDMLENELIPRPSWIYITDKNEH